MDISKEPSNEMETARMIQAIQPSSWEKTRLHEILRHHVGKKILVVGDVGLDRYTIGSVDRISPEAPVPIVLVQEEKLKLGLAANVADNIHALGATPLLLGVIGKDRSAEDFRDLLQSSGIDHAHLIVDVTRRTVLKERVVSDRQQLVRIDYESCHGISREIEAQILESFKALLREVDGVIVEDYAKGSLTESLMKSFFDAARAKNKMIAVDPNLKTPAAFYHGATILTPNTKEAEHLSGVKIRDEKSLLEAGATILRSTSAQHVVVTRGKDGMAIFSRDTEVVRMIPTYAKDVYDVSGAGDTVISVLMLALVSGATIEEASILGNLAGGIEVGKRGTATVTPDEIREVLDSF
jgi:rfaE bifunctional protein kinase chain/domain